MFYGLFCTALKVDFLNYYYIQLISFSAQMFLIFVLSAIKVFLHMDILKSILFLSLISSVVFARHVCPDTNCGQKDFSIRFPFRLEQQPQDCGYPGFDLRCNDQDKTILNLPYSEDFFVRDINYLTQEIQLYDPNDCLPRLFLNLNLSSSPFLATYYQNYTFLSCPSEFHISSNFTLIDCLSNSTISILAAISSTSLAGAKNMCTVINTLPIPVSAPVQNADLNYGDLLLTWNLPGCEYCDANDGFCGYTNKTSQEISCFDSHRTEKRRGLQIFKVIALCIVIPAVLCSMGIPCLLCCLERRGYYRANRRTQNLAMATITPQLPVMPEGLDDSTIESYKMVVLGESRRVPGLNDITCPICLTDYCHKDTVRCLPECQHCFHAECIDEWLKINGSCPVCRSSPSPARQIDS